MTIEYAWTAGKPRCNSWSGDGYRCDQSKGHGGPHENDTGGYYPRWLDPVGSEDPIGVTPLAEPRSAIEEHGSPSVGFAASIGAEPIVRGLGILVEQVEPWHRRHFPGATLFAISNKLGEECGEVMRAIDRLGDRMDPEERALWVEKLGDEIGDVAIVLAAICYREEIPFGRVVINRWREIRQRVIRPRIDPNKRLRFILEDRAKSAHEANASHPGRGMTAHMPGEPFEECKAAGCVEARAVLAELN